MIAPASACAARNATIATVGNIIELFDYTIYGFLAVTISRVFFPIENPKLALLAALITFGMGSAVRPIGAILLGRLGDLRGRRFVMILTILMMGGSSLMIGLAPGHAQAGIAGAIILFAARFLQGLASGAEFGSAISYLVELAPPGRRGFYGSFHQVGAGLGLLTGALISALLNVILSPDQVLAWGWRLPFLFGALLSVVGLYLRLALDESPVFEAIQKHPSQGEARVPILVPVLQNAGICVLWSVSVFASVIYMPTFMIANGAITAGNALSATVLALLAMLVAIPLAGHAADRFGSKAILLTAAAGYMICALPGYWIIASGAGYGAAIGVVVVFGILCGIMSGAGPVAIGELFQAKVRTTWTSIASAVSQSIFGSFSPAIATALIYETGMAAAPGYWVMLASALTGLAAASLPRRAERRTG